jgi:Amt family ammonium transporter
MLAAAVARGAGRAVASSGARALLQIPPLEGNVPQDMLPDNFLVPDDPLDAIDTGDTAWMLTATALVAAMIIPGLACFYGGLVRPTNVLNAMSNVFFTFALVSIVWVLWGYSIAFSSEAMEAGRYNLHSLFGTLRHGGLRFISNVSSTGNYSASIFVTFHMMFACITTALVTGAFAERIKPTGAWWFAIGWSTIVYCPLAHQIWGGDGALLHSIGAIDFAGGIVVHVSSGVSGIVAAAMLGKRIGYPRIPKAPHSLVLTNIGGGLLWVGWFGFNAGSATAANYVAGQAMLVTQIASAAGAIGWTIAERSSYGRPSSLGMISGAISGLVAITPAAGSVGAMASICIGAIAGILCFYSCTSVKEALGWYDDALDVFGIHGVGGIVGAILVSFWASPLAGGNGFGTIVLHGGETHPIREVGTQLGVQLCSIAYAVVWASLGTAIVLKTVDACHGGYHWRLFGLKHVRSTPKEEENGLDDSYFTERGYNFVIDESQISVEVGPLRSLKGHGLQLYYTDDEGTRHPVTFNQEAVDADAQKQAAERIEERAKHRPGASMHFGEQNKPSASGMGGSAA